MDWSLVFWFLTFLMNLNIFLPKKVFFGGFHFFNWFPVFWAPYCLGITNVKAGHYYSGFWHFNELKYFFAKKGIFWWFPYFFTGSRCFRLHDVYALKSLDWSLLFWFSTFLMNLNIFLPKKRFFGGFHFFHWFPVFLAPCCLGITNVKAGIYHSDFWYF